MGLVGVFWACPSEARPLSPLGDYLLFSARPKTPPGVLRRSVFFRRHRSSAKNYRHRQSKVCVQQFLHENGAQLYSYLVFGFLLGQHVCHRHKTVQFVFVKLKSPHKGTEPHHQILDPSQNWTSQSPTDPGSCQNEQKSLDLGFWPT